MREKLPAAKAELNKIERMMQTVSKYDELKAEIRRQQEGLKGKPEFYIGEQLLVITKKSETDAEIVLCDIVRAEMNLQAAAKELKAYADKNHGRENVYCIDPETAAEILRKFYGISGGAEEEPEKEPEKELINLEDFL